MPSLRAAHLRHARHYEAVLRTAAAFYHEGGEALQQGLALFDLDWTNLQTGQTWAATHRDSDDEAAVLCSAYGRVGIDLLTLRRHPLERRSWLAAALQAARRLGDQVAEATHLGHLGIVSQMQGELERAEALHRQALDLYTKLGHQEGIASQYGNLGNLYQIRGALPQAETFHRQALEHY